MGVHVLHCGGATHSVLFPGLGQFSLQYLVGVLVCFYGFHLCCSCFPWPPMLFLCFSHATPMPPPCHSQIWGKLPKKIHKFIIVNRMLLIFSKHFSYSSTCINTMLSMCPFMTLFDSAIFSLMLTHVTEAAQTALAGWRATGFGLFITCPLPSFWAGEASCNISFACTLIPTFGKRQLCFSFPLVLIPRCCWWWSLSSSQRWWWWGVALVAIYCHTFPHMFKLSLAPGSLLIWNKTSQHLLHIPDRPRVRWCPRMGSVCLCLLQFLPSYHWPTLISSMSTLTSSEAQCDRSRCPQSTHIVYGCVHHWWAPNPHIHWPQLPGVLWLMT